MADKEKFRSLAKIFYKDAKLICLVYEVSIKKSFDEYINAIFQYTSAKNTSGIEELFTNIWKKVLNPTLDINEQENKEKQIYEQKKIGKTQKKTENK